MDRYEGLVEDNVCNWNRFYLESSFPILWVPFGDADSLDDFAVDLSDLDDDNDELELVDPPKRKRCMRGRTRGLDETNSKNFDRSQCTSQSFLSAERE